MSTSTPRAQFDDFLARVLENPEARAAYEDARSRNALVDALVRARRRLRMTQTELARLMGVKQPAVSGFETEGSDPRLSSVQRYARAVDAQFCWEIRYNSPLGMRADYYRPGVVRVDHGLCPADEPSPRARSWTPPPPIRHAASSFQLTT